MTVDYTIAAIPTTYRGRKYRSRLEARWAAFFDLLGWNYEYEPCDLGKWSPDFAIWGTDAARPILVEVKPIIQFDRTTARKMADACADRGVYGEYLLLGSSPGFGDYPPWDILGWIGKTGHFEAEWTTAIVGRITEDKFDVCTVYDGLVGTLWDMFFPGMTQSLRVLPTSTLILWTQAANEVQWKGPGK